MLAMDDQSQKTDLLRAALTSGVPESFNVPVRIMVTAIQMANEGRQVSFWLKVDRSRYQCLYATGGPNSGAKEAPLGLQMWFNGIAKHDFSVQVAGVAPALHLNSPAWTADVRVKLDDFNFGIIRCETSDPLDDLNEDAHQLLQSAETLAIAIYRSLRYAELRSHRKAYEMTKARELRAKTVALEQSADGVIYIGRNGEIRDASQRAVSAFGYEYEELLQIPISDLFPTKKTASAGDYQRVGCLHADGHVFHASVCNIPLDGISMILLKGLPAAVDHGGNSPLAFAVDAERALAAWHLSTGVWSAVLTLEGRTSEGVVSIHDQMTTFRQAIEIELGSDQKSNGQMLPNGRVVECITAESAAEAMRKGSMLANRLAGQTGSLQLNVGYEVVRPGGDIIAALSQAEIACTKAATHFAGVMFAGDKQTDLFLDLAGDDE